MFRQTIHTRAQCHLVIDVENRHSAINQQCEVIALSWLKADGYGKFRLRLAYFSRIGIVKCHLLGRWVKDQIQCTSQQGVNRPVIFRMPLIFDMTTLDKSLPPKW